MNWRIFLFNARTETDIPFDDLINIIKRRGKRFKLNSIDRKVATLNYAYRQGISERLGYYAGPTNEIRIEENDKTTIDFKFPKSILIGFGLLAIAILLVGLYLTLDFGLTGSIIIILILYLSVVVRLNSQYYYFKSDLEEIENNFQKTKRTIKSI